MCTESNIFCNTYGFPKFSCTSISVQFIFLTSEQLLCSYESELYPFQELQQQLEGIRAHLKTLDENITKYNDNRIFLSEEDDIATRRNFEKLEDIEERLKRMKPTDTEEEYDIDAAAEVLAAVYPDDRPRDILREQGIPFDDDLSDLSPSSATSDDDDNSKFKTPPDDEVCITFFLFG